MSLNLSKASAGVSLQLDVLKLVEKTTADVIACVGACFYTSGQLAESLAVKNLYSIRGEMIALQNMLKSIG